MSGTIYAVLVGINAYPSRPLYGCINDVLALHAFLQGQATGNRGTKVNAVLLLAPHPAEARQLDLDYDLPTRSNIIAAFEHFAAADPARGDSCLFYFSGHGSRQAAPEVFHHSGAGTWLETLVCLDSRRPGGRDLLDKELSYLIWNTDRQLRQRTPAGQLPGQILVITDCCHAGNNTRSSNSLTRVREDAPQSDAVNLEEYHGFAEGYFEVHKERVRFPFGRHVHLAASRATEPAREGIFGGSPRGAFTYSLLRVLKSAGVRLSYRAVINRTRILLQTRVQHQLPQLFATVRGDEHLTFPGGEKIAEESLLVFRRAGEWILNAGMSQGVFQPSAASGNASVRILSDDRIIPVVTVRLNESVLASQFFEAADVQSTAGGIAVEMHEVAAPRIGVFIEERHSQGSEPQVELEDVLKKYNPLFYTLTDTAHPRAEVLYCWRPRDGGWTLTPSDSQQPLFPPQSSVYDLLECTEIYARWWSLLNLENHSRKIPAESIQLEADLIEGMEMPLDLWGISSGQPLVKNPTEIHLRCYTGRLTGLRLRIKCLAGSVFVRVLFFGSKFGISEHLNREVSAGNEGAWIEFVQGQFAYQVLPVSFDPVYRQLGVDTVTDYIKIFVSTQPFPDTFEEQGGISLQGTMTPGKRAGRNFRKNINHPKWATITIPVYVHGPASSKNATA